VEFLIVLTVFFRGLAGGLSIVFYTAVCTAVLERERAVQTEAGAAFRLVTVLVAPADPEKGSRENAKSDHGNA
jgi:hypothetical protein